MLPTRAANEPNSLEFGLCKFGLYSVHLVNELFVIINFSLNMEESNLHKLKLARFKLINNASRISTQII